MLPCFVSPVYILVTIVSTGWETKAHTKPEKKPELAETASFALLEYVFLSSVNIYSYVSSVNLSNAKNFTIV